TAGHFGAPPSIGHPHTLNRVRTDRERRKQCSSLAGSELHLMKHALLAGVFLLMLLPAPPPAIADTRPAQPDKNLFALRLVAYLQRQITANPSQLPIDQL